MMESLTDELAEKATEIIDEVEAAGGMTSYINSGMAKLRIEESATKKQVSRGHYAALNIVVRTISSNLTLLLSGFHRDALIADRT